MSKLVPIQLDNGMLLYIEAQDETETPSLPSPTLAPEPEEQTRGGQKGLPIKKPQISMEQSMHLVQNTIRTYAKYCMDSFQNLGNANLSEVTLEFGINLSADAGIPYIASGKAQSNLKITVKCTYPQAAEAEPVATTNAMPEMRRAPAPAHLPGNGQPPLRMG